MKTLARSTNGTPPAAAKAAAVYGGRLVYKVALTAGREVLRFAAWLAFVLGLSETLILVGYDFKFPNVLEPWQRDRNMLAAAMYWWLWWKFK